MGIDQIGRQIMLFAQKLADFRSQLMRIVGLLAL